MPLDGFQLLPGQIVRAEVQYSDSEGTKSRFPVVVSCAEFNRENPEVIVAFTTSRPIRQPREYDVHVSARHPEFSLTGLTKDTTVRCGRLWTIDKRKISDVIGCMPKDLLVDIKRLVRACFSRPS